MKRPRLILMTSRRQKQDDYHLTERRYGSFQRSFRVHETVNEDKIDAHLEKGVLHVKMAKKPEAAGTAKKISVAQK